MPPLTSNHVLQDEMLDYLKARNIDEDLATFICMYADQKEQTEYMNWLQAVSYTHLTLPTICSV